MSGIYNPSADTLGISNLGNTAGTSGVISGPNLQLLLAGGNNITLSQSTNGSSATVTVIGPTVPVATNFSLNASSSSVSLVAGAGIAFNSGASSISVSMSSVFQSAAQISASGGGATAGASGAITSGSLILCAGSNITLSQTTGASINSVTIIGPAVPTATNFSLNGTSSSVSLVAGAGITFNSGASSITILGNTTAAQTAQPIWLSGSSIAGGGFNGATATVSASTLSLIAGSGITLSQNSVNAITISGNTTAAQTAQPVWLSIGSIAGGTSSGATATASASTLSFIAGANITLSQNSSNAITISANVPTATNFSLNGTSSSVSLVAGAGIAFNSGASSISISMSSVFQSAAQISASGGGATSGASAAITSGSLILCAGSNITLSQTTGASVNSVTIIGPAAQALGTNTISASGTSIAGTALSFALAAGANISLQTATGAGSMTVSVSGLNALSASGFASSTGTMLLAAGAGLALATGASSITISATGNTVKGFGISSITAGGATAGTTSTASGSLLLAAGSNITLSSSGGGITLIGPSPSAAAISVSATSIAGGSITGGANAQFTTLQLIAGSNIGISQNGQSLTFSASGGGAAAGTISLTQNMSLQDIGGSVASATGTVTGTAGWGSSLFLQRIYIPAAMNLSEVDLALGMSFNATSDGAGTLSQSFVLYSFGNSSSLASVLSASSAFAWQTGTSTSGAVVSLTQFQGGWSVPQIYPMTFASTSISQGEYVAGHLLNFDQGSSTWTINLLGKLASITNSTTITGVSNIASLTIRNAEGTATSTSSSGTVQIKNIGLSAVSRTILTASSTQSVVPQYLTIPNLVYIGTGSTTSALPSVFIAGIMSTGAVPLSIAVTSTAVTYSGTAAGAQPYFGLVGA